MTLSPEQMGELLDAVRGELDALIGLGELPNGVFSSIEGKIPPSKVKNLCHSAQVTLEPDEEIIFLVDNTTFGSAKKGWAVTGTRIIANTATARGVVYWNDVKEIKGSVEDAAANGKVTFESAEKSLPIHLSENQPILYEILKRSFDSVRA